MLRAVGRFALQPPVQQADERSVVLAAKVEPVSPELVLVDSDLAQRARAGLPVPTDTVDLIARRRFVARSHDLTPIITPAAATVPLVRDEAAAALRRLSRLDVELEMSSGGRRRHRVLLGLACVLSAIVVIGAGLVDVWRGEPNVAPGSGTTSVANSGTPAEVKANRGTLTGASAASTHGSATVSGQKSLAGNDGGRAGESLSTTQPRPVVWKATPKATSYHIEVFRDQQRLFVTDSPGNRVTVPATWDLGGVQRRLQPGDRLYAWPVVGGRRQPATINGDVLGTAGQLRPPASPRP